MPNVSFEVVMTTDELKSLRCLAKRHNCEPDTLAGLFIYRGLMDSLTGRLNVGQDAEALRSMSLGTYA
jgi:hypothetical protein